MESAGSHSHTTNTQSTSSVRTSTKIYNSSNTEITNTGGMSANATGAIRAYYSDMQREGNITVQASYFSGRAGGVDSFGSTSNNAGLKIDVSHTHNMQHNHTVDISHTHGTDSKGSHTHTINYNGSSTDQEARPDNYTIKLWKRTA